MSNMYKRTEVTCTSIKLYTSFSLRDNLAIGTRGVILKTFEENMIIDVANTKRDRQRDGDNEPTKDLV